MESFVAGLKRLRKDIQAMLKQQELHGQPEARLRIVLPTGETYERQVSGVEILIGRGAHNDILISDPAVSSTHAVLTFYGDSYFILDEEGEGGTFVNGEKVAKLRKLWPGDVIKIGQSQIIFTPKLSAAAQMPAPPKTAVTAETASEDQGAKAEKKKAKKDKEKRKESKDERIKAAKVRAWGGIIATVLSVVLTVTISLIVTRIGSNQPSQPVVYRDAQAATKLAGLSESRRFRGGTYEASSAVAVPGANGILFVDDSKPDHVFYMQVNELGEQEGVIKAIPLGVRVENPEGISQFGSRFMIVGSLSTHESNDRGGLAAFDFEPATQTVSRAVALTGMRKFLFDNVPELKPWANKTGPEGGLNVEGIAVDPDPQHPRVLLGLRGPLLNGRALVVPIKLRDRQAPLSLENLVLAEPNAIELILNGQAIRDIQYDSRLRSFLIISGAPETEQKTDFTLWLWGGDSNQVREEARPKRQALLDKKMKPEGVTHLKISAQEFVFIVGDASYYARMDYLSP
jgi:pSer/pThr/pTyr-binding forkhead associated (FHA) protein